MTSFRGQTLGFNHGLTGHIRLLGECTSYGLWGGKTRSIGRWAQQNIIQVRGSPGLSVWTQEKNILSGMNLSRDGDSRFDILNLFLFKRDNPFKFWVIFFVRDELSVSVSDGI